MNTKPVDCIIQNGVDYCQQQSYPSVVFVLVALLGLALFWVIYLIWSNRKKYTPDGYTPHYEDLHNEEIAELQTTTNKGQTDYFLPEVITKNIKVLLNDELIECEYYLRLSKKTKQNQILKLFLKRR